MNGSILEVIIIGAGHAGLSASYYLKQLGLEHIVFERGRIGETWRSQRWDSFTMNTTNRLNALPGSAYKGKKPEQFSRAEEYVTSLEGYAASFQLPVSVHTNVLSIEKQEGAPYFNVTVSHENEPPRNYNCWQIIIASGGLNESKIPSFANLISSEIKQLHTIEYTNSAQLPDGGVLVIGSAQSGCQITEDLLDAGRKVYLSTSKVPRIPRSYRGKDTMDWLIEGKFIDAKSSDTNDPTKLLEVMPLVSGAGVNGHSISLQYLAGKGAILLGTMYNAAEQDIFFRENVLEHVEFADNFSKKLKERIDEFILRKSIQVSEGEIDYADLPAEHTDFYTPTPTLNLEEHEIRSILWATGLKGNFSYIKLPVLDSEGQPKHDNGVTAIEGLYFLGGSGSRGIKSNLIHGIKDDAGVICNKVYRALR